MCCRVRILSYKMRNKFVYEEETYEVSWEYCSDSVNNYYIASPRYVSRCGTLYFFFRKPTKSSLYDLLACCASLYKKRKSLKHVFPPNTCHENTSQGNVLHYGLYICMGNCILLLEFCFIYTNLSKNYLKWKLFVHILINWDIYLKTIALIWGIYM